MENQMKKKAVFVFYLFVMFWMFSPAWAGVNDYVFSQVNAAFQSITGTQILEGIQDDAVTDLIDIGFTFRFNNTDFTQFSASSNGFIRLGAKPSVTDYTPLSTPRSNCISAAAINGRVIGDIRYLTHGTAPNRIASIQYNNFQLRTDNSNRDLLTFQIRLHETTNMVEIVYGGRTSNYSHYLQVGIRGEAIAPDYANRTGSDWANSSAGTSANDTMRWRQNNYPASGLRYRWTPPFFEISPNSITRYLSVNTIKQDKVTLSNKSNTNVTINSISAPPSWLTHDLITPTTIPANGSIDINYTLNAGGMTAGEHTVNLAMQSSAGPITLFVSMKVTTASIPVQPRHIAQWEPARGAIIHYPLVIPDEMVQDLFHNNDELFVVVGQHYIDTEYAYNYFQNTLDIDPNQVTWIEVPYTDSEWVRDYGPMSIFHGPTGNRKLAILDFSYNRPRDGDNAVNAAIADQLNLDYFFLPIATSGGNILTNGKCQEFADDWVFQQNDTDPLTGLPSLDGYDENPHDYQYTLTEFLDLMQLYRGELIENGFHLWPDPLGDYLHHIDRWAKLLSPNTLLIAGGMGGNTEAALDAIAAEMALFPTCVGGTYNIVRINCPDNEPYTNSYILNDQVYVPFMGGDSPDLAALAVYESAMPGYTVKGYLSRPDEPWTNLDAIHCRTNTIYKTQGDSTVPVELSSFTASISADSFVNLSWVTQTETGVLGFYVIRNTESDLANATTVSNLIPATNTSEMQRYVFKDTELYDAGDYFYWLQHNDLDGSTGFHGPISIHFNTPGGSIPEIPLVTQLDAIYPNPFNPRAYIPFSLKSHSSVSIEIYNVRGQLVKSFPLGQKTAGYHRIEWDGRDDLGRICGTGIYHIRMNVGNDSYLRKVVLMK